MKEDEMGHDIEVVRGMTKKNVEYKKFEIIIFVYD